METHENWVETFETLVRREMFVIIVIFLLLFNYKLTFTVARNFLTSAVTSNKPEAE